MSLLDRETFGSDEYRDWNWGAISTGTLSSAGPHREFSTLWACVGGEVRGELFLIADYYPTVYPDWVRFTAQVKYFEGTSCYTTDLQKSSTSFGWVQRGVNYKWTLPTLSDGEGYVANVVRLTVST